VSKFPEYRVVYGVGNKLFATFDSFTLDPKTLAIDVLVPPDLWEINPLTGVATHIASTTLNLGGSVHVENKIYAFHLVSTPAKPLTEAPAESSSSFAIVGTC
jgi:hypothetical protein